jgi:NAD(P)H-dependent FMN reductase
MSYKLKIISATVRPGRKAPIVVSWILGLLEAYPEFEAEYLDLARINLPMMNEPAHPVMRQYEHDHTKQWSKVIDEADAFIFVTSEYDHSYPAPLKNALEYLVHEWGYKAAGLVGYSKSAFGGVRALHSLKTDLLSLKVVSLAEQVPLPLIDQHITDDDVFEPNDYMISSSSQMLKQLLRWTKGMKSIREDK